MACENLGKFPEHMFSPLCFNNRLLYFEVFFEFVRKFESHIIRKSSFDDAVSCIESCIVRERLNYYVDEEGVAVEKDSRKAARSVLDKLCRSDIGWLKKNDFDSEFSGKSVEVTHTGDYIYTKVILGTFDDLKNERWSCDINAIEDAISNDDNWEAKPFNYGLMNVLEMTRNVSDRLKQLNTIIEQIMVQANRDRTLNRLAENIRTFYDSSFMPLYREMKDMLPPEKREDILSKLDLRFSDPEAFELLLNDYMETANIREEDRGQALKDVGDIHREMHNYFEIDYPDTISQIQAKMSRYFMIMNYQLRFEHSHGRNTQELLERFIIDGRDKHLGITKGKGEVNSFIAASTPLSYIDSRSLRSFKPPYKITAVDDVFDDTVSEEEREQNRDNMRAKMNDRFSLAKIREYSNKILEGKKSVRFSDVEASRKEDVMILFLTVLEAAANGLDVESPSGKVIKGNFEIDNMGIKRRD